MTHPVEHLVDYVDGTLPARERAVVREHLQTCSRCRDEVALSAAAKQELADGVLDGLGDLSALQMPSGRTALVERLDAMIGADPVEGPILERAEFCAERLRDDLLARYGESLLLLETRRDAAGTETVLAVIDGPPDSAANEAAHLSRIHSDIGEKDAGGPRFEVLDRSGYGMLKRLVETGIVSFSAGEVRRLHA